MTKGVYIQGVSVSGGSASGGVCIRGGGLPLGGISIQVGSVFGGRGWAVRDTVNKRAARILLECILAYINSRQKKVRLDWCSHSNSQSTLL